MRFDPSAPPSPCTRRCTLDEPALVCIGCRRTLAEIMGWQSFSADQKLAVLIRIGRVVPSAPTELLSGRSG